MPLGTGKAGLLGAAAGGFTWDLLDSNCSSTSDGGTWALSGGPSGGGCTQVTYDSQSTFKMDSGGSAADGAYGQAYIALEDSDLSSATVWPDPFTLECRIYIYAFGKHHSGALNDQLDIYVYGQNSMVNLRFTTAYTGSGSSNPYGTRWVTGAPAGTTALGALTDDWSGAWHTVGIYAHSYSGSSPLVTADVYIDGALKGTGLTRTVGATQGAGFAVTQKGYQNASRISYIDWVRIGTGDGRSVITA